MYLHKLNKWITYIKWNNRYEWFMLSIKNVCGYRVGSIIRVNHIYNIRTIWGAPVPNISNEINGIECTMQLNKNNKDNEKMFKS